MNIDKMTNIRGINILEEIKDAINSVNNKLNGLTKEQTCKIYSSFIYEELKQRHIPSRIINTLDLGLSYEHEFVIVNVSNDYYLIDLTFKQFNNDQILELQEHGFIKINNEILSKYLSIINNSIVNECNIDDMFFKTR